MYNPKPSANAKFYMKQAREFEMRDRDCKIKHMTRSAFALYGRFFEYHQIKEVNTAYGLHKGQRGVLLSCPKWKQDCWVMFLD